MSRRAVAEGTPPGPPCAVTAQKWWGRRGPRGGGPDEHTVKSDARCRRRRHGDRDGVGWRVACQGVQGLRPGSRRPRPDRRDRRRGFPATSFLVASRQPRTFVASSWSGARIVVGHGTRSEGVRRAGRCHRPSPRPVGEEGLEPVVTTADIQGSIPSPQTLSAVLTALDENVRRLTATIAGATTEDWRRREPDTGATPGELVWLALHDATHHLEDAELLLDAAPGRAATTRHASGIHSVPALEEAGGGVEPRPL